MTWKVIDAFSGAGGLSLGFSASGGFDTVLAVESDISAARSYALNFRADVVHADIREWLTNGTVPSADLVIAGLPCQAFSLLNKKKRADPRASLWRPFFETVERAGAKAFLIENVAEMLRSPEFAPLQERANELGFRTVSAVLNTADYGAPQTRKRAIVIGWRQEVCSPPSFPPQQSHSQSDRNLPRWRTVREAIGDLPSPVGVDIRPTAAPENLHFGRTPTTKSIDRYRAIPPGGNRFDLQRVAPELTPGCWIRKTSGGTDLFGRLWWDRPSVTIRTEFFKPEKGRYLHPEQDRPITHREAARLMGFPDSFRFCGTKIDVAKQIGNAVPPQLALALAKMLQDALAGTSAPPASNQFLSFGLSSPTQTVKHQYSPPSTH